MGKQLNRIEDYNPDIKPNGKYDIIFGIMPSDYTHLEDENGNQTNQYYYLGTATKEELENLKQIESYFAKFPTKISQMTEFQRNRLMRISLEFTNEEIKEGIKKAEETYLIPFSYEKKGVDKFLKYYSGTIKHVSEQKNNTKEDDVVDAYIYLINTVINRYSHFKHNDTNYLHKTYFENVWNFAKNHTQENEVKRMIFDIVRLFIASSEKNKDTLVYVKNCEKNWTSIVDSFKDNLSSECIEFLKNLAFNNKNKCKKSSKKIEMQPESHIQINSDTTYDEIDNKAKRYIKYLEELDLSLTSPLHKHFTGLPFFIYMDKCIREPYEDEEVFKNLLKLVSFLDKNSIDIKEENLSTTLFNDKNYLEKNLRSLLLRALKDNNSQENKNLTDEDLLKIVHIV